MLDSGRTLPTAAEKEAYITQWNREQIANYGPILYVELSEYERYFVRQAWAKRNGWKEVPHFGQAEIEEYNQRIVEQFNKEFGSEAKRSNQ